MLHGGIPPHPYRMATERILFSRKRLGVNNVLLTNLQILIEIRCEVKSQFPPVDAGPPLSILLYRKCLSGILVVLIKQ